MLGREFLRREPVRAGKRAGSAQVQAQMRVQTPALRAAQEMTLASSQYGNNTLTSNPQHWMNYFINQCHPNKFNLTKNKIKR